MSTVSCRKVSTERSYGKTCTARVSVPLVAVLLAPSRCHGSAPAGNGAIGKGSGAKEPDGATVAGGRAGTVVRATLVVVGVTAVVVDEGGAAVVVVVDATSTGSPALTASTPPVPVGGRDLAGVSMAAT